MEADAEVEEPKRCCGVASRHLTPIDQFRNTREAHKGFKAGMSARCSNKDVVKREDGIVEAQNSGSIKDLVFFFSFRMVGLGLRI